MSYMAVLDKPGEKSSRTSGESIETHYCVVLVLTDVDIFGATRDFLTDVQMEQ